MLTKILRTIIALPFLVVWLLVLPPIFIWATYRFVVGWDWAAKEVCMEELCRPYLAIKKIWSKP